MKRKKLYRRICKILLTLILLWLVAGSVDYFRVHSFEKPIFARLDISTAKKDGGSGTFKGLGYSFDIEGNFIPEDEFPGVTQYKYYLFGNLMQERFRD